MTSITRGDPRLFFFVFFFEILKTKLRCETKANISTMDVLLGPLDHQMKLLQMKMTNWSDFNSTIVDQ